MLKLAEILDMTREKPNTGRFVKSVCETLELIPMPLRGVEQWQESIGLDQPHERAMMVTAPPHRAADSVMGRSKHSSLLAG